MIDLQEIIDEKITSLEHHRKEAAIERDNAPTRMEARYDASRPNADHMVEAIEVEINKLTLLKRQVNNPPLFSEIAIVNTLVTLKSALVKHKYLLVPEGLGGTKVGDILLLSVDSPLAKTFLNRKIGFQFTFNTSKYEIISLQPNSK